MMDDGRRFLVESCCWDLALDSLGWMYYYSRLWTEANTAISPGHIETNRDFAWEAFNANGT